MLTDIVESSDAAVLLSDDENGLAPDLRDDVVARFGDVRLPAAKEPDLAPDALPLELHEVPGGVAARIDWMPLDRGIRRLPGRSVRTFFRTHAAHRLELRCLRADPEVICVLRH